MFGRLTLFSSDLIFGSAGRPAGGEAGLTACGTARGLGGLGTVAAIMRAARIGGRAARPATL